ncbi:MAG: hypothetical protein K2W82_04085 [Candidatus Obscuribacterales bacterium]|nr:hypothetical protein [Candidatus Obscuribacterales bacterium]
MRKIITVGSVFSLIAGLVVCTVNQSSEAKPWPDGVDARQNKQEERIDQGINSGALTKREAKILDKRQNILKNRESILRTTGQKLSHAERGRLEKRQNKLSNKIHAQKHDKQKA